jgi:hypothetical protein
MRHGHEMSKTTAVELQRLELMLLDPGVRRDRKRVEELLAEDFLEFGSSGRVWTREATLELLATETYIQPGVEDFACRMLSDDVALLTYRSVRRKADGGVQAEALRSSVWIRTHGKWKMRFHQGTATSRA